MTKSYGKVCTNGTNLTAKSHLSFYDRMTQNSMRLKLPQNSHITQSTHFFHLSNIIILNLLDLNKEADCPSILGADGYHHFIPLLRAKP